MRKVLLTTTALVALAGASTASAIDISGSYAFDYRGVSNTGGSADASEVSGDNFGSDALIKFSGSQESSDGALTFGAHYSINAAAGVEDQGITIDGDFGHIMMGATDGVVDGMDGFMQGAALVEVGVGGTTNSTAAGVALLTTPMVTDNATQPKIGYRTNVISGFQAGASYEDGGAGAAENDDVSSWILTYDFGVAKIGYARSSMGSTANDGADTTRTHYGIGTTLAGVTIGYGIGNSNTNDTAISGNPDTSNIDTHDLGLSYSVDANIGIYAQSLRSEEKTGSNAGDKVSGQSYGLSYTIAPGVSALVEFGSVDYVDATAGSVNSDGRTNTAAFLSVAF
jgi:hypothetical protein